MTDDITKDLSDSEKLNLILSRLTAIETDVRDVKTRLTAIEEERARDTRPLLGEIRKEIGEARMEITEVKEGQVRIEARLEHLEQQFEVFTLDIMQVRAAQRALGGRVAELERRPS